MKFLFGPYDPLAESSRPSQARVLLNGGAYVGLVRGDGSFSMYVEQSQCHPVAYCCAHDSNGVPPGQYVAEVQCIDHLFDPVWLVMWQRMWLTDSYQIYRVQFSCATAISRLLWSLDLLSHLHASSQCCVAVTVCLFVCVMCLADTFVPACVVIAQIRIDVNADGHVKAQYAHKRERAAYPLVLRPASPDKPEYFEVELQSFRLQDSGRERRALALLD